MSVNRYRPHLWVIPEDDANRQVANGFLLHDAVIDRSVQIMAPAGGWPRVLATFTNEYVPLLNRYPMAHVVMLVDFDEDENRRDHFEKEIPPHLANRVFLIGARDTPESLRRELNRGFEAIGGELAQNCRDEEYLLWAHAHLAHNDAELQRLVEHVRPFLFAPG